MIDPQSANYIYEHVDSDEKDIKWYHESGHVLQLIKKRTSFEDVSIFRIIRLDRINLNLKVRKEGHNEFKAIHRRNN